MITVIKTTSFGLEVWRVFHGATFVGQHLSQAAAMTVVKRLQQKL